MADKFKIIACPEWGALLPRDGLNSIVWTPGMAERIIFHHTAGHFREQDGRPGESVFESIVYARDMQHFHMAAPPRGRGWNDTGQNFSVFRNGVITQGRWRTVRSIQARRMVVSAHCPGQNDQIGIEHEHVGGEEMTKVQKEASAWLQAWIADRYRKTRALPVFPHSKFFNTSCPANLIDDMHTIQEMANRLLRLGNL